MTPRPTWRRHLGDAGAVGSVREARLVVVDVLNPDDELGLWFQGNAAHSVHGLGPQGVGGLLLPGNQAETPHGPLILALQQLINTK